MATNVSTISFAEFLRLEAASIERHEFFQGQVFEIAGGSPIHAGIASNLIREVGNSLENTACRVFGSDLGIKLPGGLYTYADATICCGPQYEGDFLLNPVTIFEILSESTEAYDRGKKFERYRELLSLEEYVLIAQDRVYVEHWTRQADGLWSMREIKPPKHGSLTLLRASVDLSELYDSVDVQ